MDPDFLQKKFIATDAGKIYYFIDDTFPNRPWVVFLHGLSANHTTWSGVVALLRAQQYNCLMVDMRGHGYSDKTRRRSLYTFPRFTSDLRQIVEHERIKHFILVGYSFGGCVALDYALHYPSSLSGLMLISANYINPIVERGFSVVARLLTTFLNGVAYLMLWQKRRRYFYYQYQKTALRGYWYSVYEGLKSMPISVNLWLMALMSTLDFSGELKQLYFPTTVVRAEHDPFFSVSEAKTMATRLGAEVVTIVHPNHFLASHAQDKVSGIILEFLTDVCA
ncbi:MAG: alpha/beta hydrolase [Patescibacteria group bacterium]|jgi:pimeloyl-ACP methyl ester carboxylesterase